MLKIPRELAGCPAVGGERRRAGLEGGARAEGLPRAGLCPPGGGGRGGGRSMISIDGNAPILKFLGGASGPRGRATLICWTELECPKPRRPFPVQRRRPAAASASARGSGEEWEFSSHR